MALTDNIRNFLNEHKLHIAGTAVGATALAGLMGIYIANATARHRLPPDLANNATVLDEKVIGDTKYMLLIHHDDHSQRNYWTGDPNCLMTVEYYDNGTTQNVKSVHFRLSNRESEGFLPPLPAEYSAGVR